MSSLSEKLNRVAHSRYFPGFLVFLFFTLLRWIPEKAIGQFPVGYDTVTDYPNYFIKPIGFFEAITSYNFLHWFFYYSNQILNFDIWWAIKFWGAILFGLLNLMVFLYSKKSLKLNQNESFLLTLIFALSLPALRVSVDLFRNELGLIFFFVFLITLENLRQDKASLPEEGEPGDEIKQIHLLDQSSDSLKLNQAWRNYQRSRAIKSKLLNSSYLKKLFLLLVSSLLIFASHQIVLVLLFIALISRLLAKLASSPQRKHHLLLFAFFYLAVVLSPTIFEKIQLGGINLWQYYLAPDITNSIPEKLYPVSVATYFYFLYAPILPFVIAGLITKRNNFYAILLLILLFISISPVIYGGGGFMLWDRWMYLLIIPFAYFAYFGFITIWQASSQKLPRQAILTLAILFLIWQPLAYLNSGSSNARLVAFNLPDSTLRNYFPTGMAQNSLGYFNNPFHRDFFVWFSNYNRENLPILLDRSLITFAKVNGLKSPIMETNYGQLSGAQRKEFTDPDTTFYTLDGTYGLPNMMKVYQYGNVVLYRSID